MVVCSFSKDDHTMPMPPIDEDTAVGVLHLHVAFGKSFLPLEESLKSMYLA